MRVAPGPTLAPTLPPPCPARKTRSPTSDPDPRRTRDPAPSQPRPQGPTPARVGRVAAPPARAHLPQPGVSGPRAPPPQRLSQRQARMQCPRLCPVAAAATSGDGAARRLPRARGAGRGAWRGAARRQVRAERGALCGGGAGTAVRAAPARARSATPSLGTRAGSAGRGQSPGRPSIRRGPGARSRGRPLCSGCVRVRTPTSPLLQSPPSLSLPG